VIFPENLPSLQPNSEAPDDPAEAGEPVEVVCGEETESERQRYVSG